MQNLPSISDAFTEVVNNTQVAIIGDSSLVWGNIPKRLYFMQGNFKEVMARLQTMTNTSKKNEKYPLIVLFRDFVEELTTGTTGYTTSFKCKLAIFTLTDGKFNADQRELLTFKPILRPILKHFLYQISISSIFGQPTIEQMKLTKIDCFFYGTNLGDKNVLNDFVDAIEIESITLKINNNFCN